MTMVFDCSNCGKRFYIHGEAEVLFNRLSDAALYLRMMGYKGVDVPIWKVIQNRAKCCDSPDINIVSWK